ncbi:glycosyltransferase [Chelatococcus reniformis]|uniref:Glycosyl transferase family 1 n=1 Tax=Chelatococcus reniformis TaxID=1494448 RepID=A0A916TXS2_9HYPH|nr:nucleotide disphospho-sugar-binding domain-containing protein [Chelatococcus reniformis]GGC48606.1 glycosyl transferase family 1 [Chelatococcus reniformis]
MKPSILLIGEAVTLTHVLRPKIFADALHAAGYTVTLACDPRFEALMGDKPYRTIPITSVIDADTNAQFLKRNQPLFGPETLATYAKEDTRLMRLVRPQLVVGDMRQSLSISARRLNVPYVNIINAHWSPYSDEPLGLVDNPLTGLVGREVADRMAEFLAPFGSALVGLPLNMARLGHGLPPLGLTLKDAFADGDYVVYPDVPEINPTRGLPPEHRYVGPVHWVPSVPGPDWWDTMPADKPIIYVNLGSSGEAALLADIAAALADLPVTAVVGTANKGAVGPVAPNVLVANFIPGDEATRRAALVISSGGASPAYQALAQGAPVLGIPSNTDQLVFARIVERLSAGRCLLEGDATVASIRHAVTSILDDPRYRTSAGKQAAVLKTYDAPRRFVAFVEEILSTAGRRRAPARHPTTIAKS